MKQFCFSLLLLFTTGAALADAPEIVGTQFERSGESWRISVTLAHPDTGWDHYADGWEVLDGAGNLLAERPLAHPHVNEQPFTRSTSGVALPEGLSVVYIRAKCSRDGWVGEALEVDLPQ